MVSSARATVSTAVVRQGADGTATSSGGTPVALDAGHTYTVTINDFMMTGGDGYPNVRTSAATQDLLDQDVAEYFATLPAARSPGDPASNPLLDRTRVAETIVWPALRNQPIRALRLLAAAAILAFLLAALPGAASAHEGVARADPRTRSGKSWRGCDYSRCEDLRADDTMSIALLGERPNGADDGHERRPRPLHRHDRVSREAPSGNYAVEAVAPGRSHRALVVEGAPVSNGDGAPPGQD
jgi:hypothetical protein